jgi:hypothetical protein
MSGKSARHGLVNTPCYNSWRNMLRRCYRKLNSNYKYYGGNGITVCKRWHVFVNFYADMGERPDGQWLDRKDLSKGYEPSNCQWDNNKAFNRRNTNWFEVKGERMPLAHAARRLGLKSNNSIYQKLQQGWSKPEIVEYYS